MTELIEYIKYPTGQPEAIIKEEVLCLRCLVGFL